MGGILTGFWETAVSITGATLSEPVSGSILTRQSLEGGWVNFEQKTMGGCLFARAIRGGRGVWSGLATATEAHEWDLDVVCESCGAGGGWGEHEGRVVDTEPQRSKRPLVAPALSGRLSSAPFRILGFAWSSAVPL